MRGQAGQLLLEGGLVVDLQENMIVTKQLSLKKTTGGGPGRGPGENVIVITLQLSLKLLGCRYSSILKEHGPITIRREMCKC